MNLNTVFAQNTEIRRYYNEQRKWHFWTAFPEETEKLGGWKFIGIAFYTPKNGKPVHRYFNNSYGHFYTINPDKENLEGWTDEGIAFYSPNDGEPVHRYYHKENKNHFWTIYPELERLSDWTYISEPFNAYKSKYNCDLSNRFTELNQSGKTIITMNPACEDGYFIKNPFDSELEIHINPKGKICINVNDREASTMSFNGISTRTKLIYPYNLGALIGVNEDGKSFFIGEEKIYNLKANETIKLQINDCEGCHSDNSNFAEIEISYIANEKVEEETPKNAVKVKSKTVTVKIWDDQQEDGDIVSVFLNDARIKNEISVKKSEHIFTIELKEGVNTFKLLAHNEGKNPPNTAAILIDDGNEEYKRVLSSKKDEFAELKIVLE